MQKIISVSTLLIIVSVSLFFLARNNKQVDYLENINVTSELINNNNDAEDDLSFIENLRQREYKPSEVAIESTVSQNEIYTGYIFSYISDSLKIYGRMNVPNDSKPSDGFPVVILNHGYFNQSSFTSGDGTQTMADILARNGYLTLASDYRGFGRSKNDTEDSRGHNPNYAIDVLNLIASVGNLDNVNPNKIGMWGHSMGGEVSIRTVEATNKVKAVVLWAPTGTNREVNSNFYGGGRRSADSSGEAHNDNDLKLINTPISLHQGLSDKEVDPIWSKELYSDLEKLDKQIEYFEYPGQDHNFRNLGWGEISPRTVEFLDKYLK